MGNVMRAFLRRLLGIEKALVALRAEIERLKRDKVDTLGKAAEKAKGE